MIKWVTSAAVYSWPSILQDPFLQLYLDEQDILVDFAFRDAFEEETQLARFTKETPSRK